MTPTEERMLAVANAKGKSFTQLVRLSGLDPAEDIRFLPLEGVDFSGCDLGGFDFTGSRLHGASFEETRILGATFDSVQWTLPELEGASDYEEAKDVWRKSLRKKSRAVTDHGWQAVWGSKTLPDWVDDCGSDSFGKWISFSIKGVTQVVRFCPPGSFLIGSPDNEVGRENWEGPQVEVSFAKGFWIFDTAVSNKLFSIVMREALPSVEEELKPFDEVNVYVVEEFFARFQADTSIVCRLPSEAEWEYACRAGSTTPFCPEVAKENSGLAALPSEVCCTFEKFGSIEGFEELLKSNPAPIKGGSFSPNSWGLWHMHGNVIELCADVWNDAHDGIDRNGAARVGTSGPFVVRGGSCGSDVHKCRAAARGKDGPFPVPLGGLRPVLLVERRD